MALSYAKRNENLTFDMVELLNVKENKKEIVPRTKKTFFVDPRYMITDEDENFWIYAPNEDKYYLYYSKKDNMYTMECFPTTSASVNSNCKGGLRIYKSPTIKSESIGRAKGVQQITSRFKEDNIGNIWVYIVNFDRRNKPTSVNDGWVMFKTYHNNFLNLNIRGKKKVVTKNGELDLEKVKEFDRYLFFIEDSYAKYFGENFLQFFASRVRSGENGKKGKEPELQVSASNVDGAKYSAYSGDREKRGTWKENSDANNGFGYKRIRKVDNFVNNAYELKYRGIVQGPRSFPTYVKKNAQNVREYDYNIDYKSDQTFISVFDEESLSSAKEELQGEMKQLYRNINFDIRSEKDMYEKNFNRYNRFKLAYPEDYLGRGFAHIFFTKPDCNLVNSDGTALTSKVGKNKNFSYAWSHRKKIINSLVQQSSNKNDWNFLLSNMAEEFSLNDENITTDTTGDTFRKQRITFGKTSYESRSQGEFSIKYTDNRELDIYHMHKLWTDYINNVYSGTWYPKSEYMSNKILDYAVSVYYILTAEDGETILFWSKYYGVYPVNVPSSAYSWSKGQPVSSPEVTINYQYSIKEDFNPLSLVELNLNSHISEETTTVTYEPIFNKARFTSGNTWVGSPFIEECEVTPKSKDYVYKLRFKHVSADNI